MESLKIEECPICLELYNYGDEISFINCNHKFHTKCLYDWVKKKSNCPLCRDEIINVNISVNNSSSGSSVKKKSEKKVRTLFQCIRILFS